MELAHTNTTQEVLDYFHTDSEKGLSEDQVKKYQEKYGPNGELHILSNVVPSDYCLHGLWR